MTKLILPAAAALLLSVGVGQSHAATELPGHAAPRKKPVEATAVPPEPAAMQKWFGDKVGEILDDAGQVFKDPDEKR